MKQDHYTGVNFAFMLDLRACEALKAGQRDDAITDHTLAQRMRKDVLQLAGAHLERLGDDGGGEERYWVLASLWEAALGVGDVATMARWEAKLRTMKAADWMSDTWQAQGRRLHALLDEYGVLSKEA